MNQTGFQPYLVNEVKRYQQDIISTVHQYEMMEELKKISKQNIHRESKFLALLGKELTNLGTSLETKYGRHHDDLPALVQLSNSGGCE
jgi:ribosomal 50S subunit-associated protein YjgA (DUF615 family)